jgi:hypothetical protein
MRKAAIIALLTFTSSAVSLESNKKSVPRNSEEEA